MRTRDVVILLREATGTKCSDMRMIEIAHWVSPHREKAINLLHCLSARYSRGRGRRSEYEAEVAVVEQHQCLRLINMLLGQRVVARLHISQVHAMSQNQSVPVSA